MQDQPDTILFHTGQVIDNGEGRRYVIGEVKINPYGETYNGPYYHLYWEGNRHGIWMPQYWIVDLINRPNNLITV